MTGRSNRKMPQRDPAVGASRKAKSAKYTLKLQAEISVGRDGSFHRYLRKGILSVSFKSGHFCQLGWYREPFVPMWDEWLYFFTQYL